MSFPEPVPVPGVFEQSGFQAEMQEFLDTHETPAKPPTAAELAAARHARNAATFAVQFDEAITTQESE